MQFYEAVDLIASASGTVIRRHGAVYLRVVWCVVSPALQLYRAAIGRPGSSVVRSFSISCRALAKRAS